MPDSHLHRPPNFLTVREYLEQHEPELLEIGGPRWVSHLIDGVTLKCRLSADLEDRHYDYFNPQLIEAVLSE